MTTVDGSTGAKAEGKSGARAFLSRTLIRRGSMALTIESVRPGHVVILLILLGVPLALLGYFGERWIERSVKTSLKTSLEATLHAATAGVQIWLETCEETATAVVREPGFAVALRERMEACRGRRACEAGRIAGQLSVPLGRRAFLVNQKERSVLAFFDDEVVKSAREGLLVAADRAKAPAEFLPPLTLAESDFFTGFLMAVPEVGEGIFFAVEIDRLTFARALVAARAGQTGETYAVDLEGRLISESRFAERLRGLGILPSVSRSTVLTVEVRDPGVSLEEGERTNVLRTNQPLTEAARAIALGKSGANVDGYRDYRGTPVIGAWLSLPKSRFGIITEVDQAEAFAPLKNLERLFFSLLGLLGTLGGLIAAIGAFAARSRDRAASALKQAASLGQYRIERKIGEGGMGTVYLATHALLRRPTAVKVMSAERGADDAFARFEREVRATSELCSPNTVAIYDYGRADDGTFYYAMEYLEGLDLERLVEKQGVLPESRVIHILAQACSSLSEAHEKGLVHRDIKPSNLFLCSRRGLVDVTKILDFGVVKTTLADSTRITRSSVVIGTPEYMSPEMFDRAAAVSAQSDLYSLGAVGYFLLTGRTVFDANTMAELCTAHLTEIPIAPSQRSARSLDPTLEAIILACLDKSPSGRPAGAAALRRLLLELPIPSWSDQEATKAWANLGES